MILVSVHDVKADTWTAPYVAQSKAAAIRDFEVIVNDKERRTMISQHPEDFSLYQIGEWLDRVPVEGFNQGKEIKFSARLVGYVEFAFLAKGVDLVKEVK